MRPSLWGCGSRIYHSQRSDAYLKATRGNIHMEANVVVSLFATEGHGSNSLAICTTSRTILLRLRPASADRSSVQTFVLLIVLLTYHEVLSTCGDATEVRPRQSKKQGPTQISIWYKQPMLAASIRTREQLRRNVEAQPFRLILP